MGLGPPLCEKCMVIGELIEHYHAYNHSGWVCPVCGNDQLKSYAGFEERDWAQFEQNKKFLLFMKGQK